MGYPYDDLREFIEELKKENELIEIDLEVDWNLEIGAITRRLAEVGLGRSVKEGGLPAVMFNNVKDYPGHRISCMTHGSGKRLAMMLGHANPDKADLDELQDLILEAIDKPIKPAVVSDEAAPCKEIKLFDEECDLYAFPAPLVHDGDGGRYLGTFHLVAQKDPDRDWTNWGMYRAMIHDRRTLTGIMASFQHGPSIYYEKYVPKNEPMPYAIAIGPDPLSLLFAGTPIPPGISEMDVVGGARGKPLDVVKCELSDILVPAGSEIVIEGTIHPEKLVSEGPFGEYTGFLSPGSGMRPCYDVKAITYRNNPILSMSNMGTPVDDGDMVWATGIAASVKRDLINDNIPINAVNMLPEASGNLLVVSVRQTPYPRIAQRIMATVFSNPNSQYVDAYLIVNDDVDVFNATEVLHAMVSRIDPDKDIHVYHQTGNPVCPYVTIEERVKLTSAQVVYDGTWPVDWVGDQIPRLSSFKHIYPEEMQKKVLKRWRDYGFD